MSDSKRTIEYVVDVIRMMPFQFKLSELVLDWETTTEKYYM